MHFLKGNSLIQTELAADLRNTSDDHNPEGKHESRAHPRYPSTHGSSWRSRHQKQCQKREMLQCLFMGHQDASGRIFIIRHHHGKFPFMN